MQFRAFVATGTLAALLIPGPLLAANPAVKQYQEVHGTFDTMEDAELACLRAVGFDERSMRLYTGNLGYSWAVEDPLSFYVRRCLSNVRKEQENQEIAERRELRKQARLERALVPQLRRTLEGSTDFRLNRTRQNVRTRARQQIRGTEGQVESYEDVRSLRRVEIRARERDIRDKLEQKKEFQEQAEVTCRNKRGAQRIMCIRQEVRSMEEELYNE